MKIPTLNNEVVWGVVQKNIDLYEWVENDNHPFNVWLTVKGIVKYSNNILKYTFESHDGTKYYEVFPEDIVDLMKHMDSGKVAGSFVYVNKGLQYGIKMVHPATK